MPVRMSFMLADAECVHFRLGYFDARFVLVGVADCLHFESTLCFCGPNQLYHGLLVAQRLPLPGEADKRKEPVVDLGPLARSLWIVADGYGHAEVVGQVLQM